MIVGHNNYTDSDQPFVYNDKIFGLDTDCVLGRRLTGLLLPAFRVISVASRGNLWGQVRRTYQRPQVVSQRPVFHWLEQDDLALRQLIEVVRQANERLLLSLQASADYADLSPRLQARRYAAEAGKGRFATLMQLTRLGKLNLEAGRKIVGDPREVAGLLAGGRK